MQKRVQMNVAHHPSLEGHFPGNPIFPGAVILDRILQQCRGVFPHLHIKGLSCVKFLMLLKPDCQIDIAFSLTHSGIVHFSCQSAQQIIAKGDIEVSHG